jgi:hypothetical protein
MQLFCKIHTTWTPFGLHTVHMDRWGTVNYCEFDLFFTYLYLSNNKHTKYKLIIFQLFLMLSGRLFFSQLCWRKQCWRQWQERTSINNIVHNLFHPLKFDPLTATPEYHPTTIPLDYLTSCLKGKMVCPLCVICLTLCNLSEETGHVSFKLPITICSVEIQCAVIWSQPPLHRSLILKCHRSHRGLCTCSQCDSGPESSEVVEVVWLCLNHSLDR